MSATLRESNVTEPVWGEFECWNADSGSTEHMPPDAKALMGHKSAAQGNMVEVPGRMFVHVQWYGRMELELQQASCT